MEDIERGEVPGTFNKYTKAYRMIKAAYHKIKLGIIRAFANIANSFKARTFFS